MEHVSWKRKPQEMKTKLTLTIDEGLIPQAKRYAEAQRESLSGLVEKRQLATKLCPGVIYDRAH
jgi:hypothetical protein